MTQRLPGLVNGADCCTAASCSAWLPLANLSDDTDVVDPENAGSAPGYRVDTGRQAKEGEVIHNILRAAIRAITANQVKQTPRAGDHGGVTVCASNVEAFAATTLIFDVRLVNLNPSLRPSLTKSSCVPSEIAGFCHRPRLSRLCLQTRFFRRRFVNKFQYISHT